MRDHSAARFSYLVVSAETANERSHGDIAGDQASLSDQGGRPARHHRRLRMARRIFAAPSLKQCVRDEALPSNQIQSDDEWLGSARRNGRTSYHASCTCMMGSHAIAVVDDELRVHGLEESQGH